jgi:MFS family permease
LMEILYAFETPIYDVYLSLYALDALGLTNIQWGLLNSVFLPVTVLIGIPAGKLVDKAPRRQSLLLAYVFSALVGIFFAYTDGINWVLLAFLLRAIGQTIGFPAVHALRADLMPKEKRGRLIGLLTLAKRLAAVPSALLFAWVFDVNPQGLFVASFIINILTLCIIWVSFNKRDLEKEN